MTVVLCVLVLNIEGGPREHVKTGSLGRRIGVNGLHTSTLPANALFLHKYVVSSKGFNVEIDVTNGC